MKKVFTLFMTLSLIFGVTTMQAQDSLDAANTGDADNGSVTTEIVDNGSAPAGGDDANSGSDDANDDSGDATTTSSDDGESSGGIGKLKQLFIDGGAGFMGVVLACLILGLAFCIERIITLSLSSANTKKLLEDVRAALKQKNVEGAMEICKSTRGPVASIMLQGLERVDEGVHIVEKSIESYGSVEMGKLERGLPWIALFISLAPMLGFLGTVIGMIEAFEDIANAGAISAGIVASGIKTALLTTAFGLIVAVILQIFYNVIVSKVDSLVHNMEDASVKFVDTLVRHDIAKHED